MIFPHTMRSHPSHFLSQCAQYATWLQRVSGSDKARRRDAASIHNLKPRSAEVVAYAFDRDPERRRKIFFVPEQNIDVETNSRFTS